MSNAEKMETATARLRSLRARVGAFAQHAQCDTQQTTAAARYASHIRRFEDQVDPDRELPEEERTRRVIAARRSYMLSLALKRSKMAAAKRAKLSEQESKLVELT